MVIQNTGNIDTKSKKRLHLIGKLNFMLGLKITKHSNQLLMILNLIKTVN
jgi:hypothetical protein